MGSDVEVGLQLASREGAVLERPQLELEYHLVAAVVVEVLLPGVGHLHGAPGLQGEADGDVGDWVHVDA